MISSQNKFLKYLIITILIVWIHLFSVLSSKNFDIDLPTIQEKFTIGLDVSVLFILFTILYIYLYTAF